MSLKEKFKSFFLPDDESVPNIYNSEQADIIGAKASTLSLWLEENNDLFTQLEDKYYQYFIGVNSLLDVDLNSFEICVIKSLEQSIEQANSLADEIPRLPDIVPKLIHMLRNDDFDWQEAAKLISMDPVILVGVIQLASSPAYNLNVKDEKLASVLNKMGVLEVRKIIMKVALKPIMLFEGGHFLKHSGTKIWVHAVKSATACHCLAEQYKEDPFDAYLAGLLSNLGMAIVVKKMNDVKDFKNVPRSLHFKVKLLKLSKQLTVNIATNWKISPRVIQALTDQLANEPKKVRSPLGRILYEAIAASMQNILVDENRWKLTKQAEIKEVNVPFEKAYNKLENFTFN